MSFVGQTYRFQPIDVEPAGNTVSVTLQSDNPFESSRDIEVYTQMSGGLTDPDPEAQSHAVITPVLPGAQGMFPISGLGNTPAGQQQQQPSAGAQIALALTGALVNTGTQLFNNYLANQDAKRQERVGRVNVASMEAQARIEAARAAQAQAQAQAHAASQAALASQAASRNKQMMMYLAIGGGALLLALVAVFALSKKGGSGG